MTPRQHFPLALAHLCLDCALVGDDPRRCACGSAALLPLAAVLDRAVEPANAPLVASAVEEAR